METNESRARILDALQAEVQRRGAQAALSPDIDGISEADLRLHFPTQIDLFRALVTSLRTGFLEQLDRIRATDASPIAKLASAFDLFDPEPISGKPSWSCLFGTSGDDLITAANDFTGAIRTFRAATEARFEALLEDGVRDGSFRFQGASRTFAGLVSALLDKALRDSSTGNEPSQFREATAQLMLRVIA